MENALRIRTQVLTGHRIEIVTPELPEGAPVEVVVFFYNAGGKKRRRT